MLKEDEIIQYSKKYKKFKDRQQRRASRFITKNIFFAYNEKQLLDILHQKRYDVEHIVDLGNGSYCHEKDYDKTIQFFQTLKTEEQDYYKNDLDFYGALYCSLCDTEYCYTHDIVEALLYMDFKDDILHKYPEYNTVVLTYLNNHASVQ